MFSMLREAHFQVQRSHGPVRCPWHSNRERSLQSKWQEHAESAVMHKLLTRIIILYPVLVIQKHRTFYSSFLYPFLGRTWLTGKQEPHQTGTILSQWWFLWKSKTIPAVPKRLSGCRWDHELYPSFFIYLKIIICAKSAKHGRHTFQSCPRG